MSQDLNIYKFHLKIFQFFVGRSLSWIVFLSSSANRLAILQFMILIYFVNVGRRQSLGEVPNQGEKGRGAHQPRDQDPQATAPSKCCADLRDHRDRAGPLPGHGVCPRRRAVRRDRAAPQAEGGAGVQVLSGAHFRHQLHSLARHLPQGPQAGEPAHRLRSVVEDC